jgi:two-component system chemotaxis sensor kinase CheA
MIDRIADGKADAGAELEEAGKVLAGQLAACITEPVADPTPATAKPRDTWRIELAFGRDVLRHGMDPMSFVRYLGTLGTVESVVTRFDRMPPAPAMDAESCYMDLDIEFRGAVDRQALESVFEFVRDDCKIHIEPPRMPEGAPHEAQAPSPEAAAKTGTAHEGSLVRVRADKLDELINLVGELVIASSGVGLTAKRTANLALVESAATLEGLVEEVRDRALKLRMVPIGDTFARFGRVVRDLGRELGKDVELGLSGTDTELDKSMVEKISDPLMHLVRNALDHGIESAAERERLGKPARGQLRLNAYHESGSIVIEIADDGRGLDRARIVRRAIERGLLTADQVPTDREIHRLVMEPGFSTADAVSSISGRGVGMDVVRRNVEALRGAISIDSDEGHGTTVSLRLPLTLAIIEGFAVGVGEAPYVLPLDAVVECLELPAGDRGQQGECGYINLRGAVLPLLHLREIFDASGEGGRRQNIVVVQYAGQQAGFVVDTLMGEFQTVIKPLGRLFQRLSGISGSAILGSGEVALILDVQALVARAIGTEAARPHGAQLIS